jgi:hypothetical protein
MTSDGTPARSERNLGMNREALTALYLKEVASSGASPIDLVGADAHTDLIRRLPPERFLARPLLLGAAEREQLHADLENLRSALVSLPDRLFGGDLAAFARAVGLNDIQISAVLRSRGASVTRQSRADLYADETGFRLLEFNMGSTLGGMDNADIVRAHLSHPVLAEFSRTHRLGYTDTMAEQVTTMFAESNCEPGSFPMVALTDWPSSYASMAPYMRQFAARWRELGLDAHPCHIGELEVRDGRVWLRDRPVDVISRMFLIEDLLESAEAPGLMNPILDAAARGEVKIFTPLDSEVYASKGALAMLSDEQHRHMFDPAELASLDRILPWTRMVRPGPVTLEDGSTVDLVQYAVAHRHDLALKPTLLHGGNGVLLGWHDDTTEEQWRQQVTDAVDGPYVVQRRIRPVPELFPGPDGVPVPWIVAWGVFTVASGYGGVFARANTVDSNVGVINLGSGSSVGCAMHVLAD